MARAAKKEKEVSLETVLWNCRVALRGIGSTEKNRDAVISLVFLKFAGDKFEKRRTELLEKYGDIPAFLEKVSFYNAVNIGYLPSSIRQRIEDLFKDGKITMLFCTSTLIEGVNLPADNLFVTDFKNGTKHMKPVDFRNLIGRVGRLEYNLYGNVFLVAMSEKAKEKYEQLLEADIKPQTLSVEKGLTKPQKRNVIEALVAGTVEFEEYPRGTQSGDSYDLMRKFGITLLNDILRGRDTLVRREFTKLMKPGEEDEIRHQFQNRTGYLQENDITVSVDQSESLYQAIAQNALEFPKIFEDGSFDYDELTQFLERLCSIFKWEIYEADTLGHVGKYSHKHGKLSW